VATQSISSLRSALTGEAWRTLLQTFRTKIFLALSDDFTAKTASELCGKEEQFKLNYSISKNGHDAKVSLSSGRTTAHRSSVSASKSYILQRDFVFEPKVFGELKNAESIVLAYDGVNPLPPTLCYLGDHDSTKTDRRKLADLIALWPGCENGMLRRTGHKNNSVFYGCMNSKRAAVNNAGGHCRQDSECPFRAPAL
jgi:TraM recognition site of TraD and TraG